MLCLERCDMPRQIILVSSFLSSVREIEPVWKYLNLKSLLVVFVLYLLSIPLGHTTVTTDLVYSNYSIHSQADTREVGYRMQWSKTTRANAKQAYDNDDTYLALRLWTLLAEQGDSEAAFKIGMYYDVGESDVHDAERAVYWYRRAAEDGNLHAQHNLAVAYANGDGVSMDIQKAIRWWTLAARHGNADSQYNLGILYAMGVYGIQKDIDKAKRWWRKAAMNGDPMAQYNLGTLYVNGDVLSYCEATRWWEESARKGVQQASWALEVIKTRQDYRACW